MKTEGLEKKLSEILDELHKYSPHAWEQMVSYEFASAVIAVLASMFAIAASFVGAAWVRRVSKDEIALGFSAAMFVVVALSALVIIASNTGSLFFPEAAVLRSIFR